MPGLLPLFKKERYDDGRETTTTALTTTWRGLINPGQADELALGRQGGRLKRSPGEEGQPGLLGLVTCGGVTPPR
jgi:hypothetical protein